MTRPGMRRAASLLCRLDERDVRWILSQIPSVDRKALLAAIKTGSDIAQEVQVDTCAGDSDVVAQGAQGDRSRSPDLDAGLWQALVRGASPEFATTLAGLRSSNGEWIERHPYLRPATLDALKRLARSPEVWEGSAGWAV